MEDFDTTAFEQGFNDFTDYFAGFNPYPIRSKNHALWIRGFESAKAYEKYVSEQYIYEDKL